MVIPNKFVPRTGVVSDPSESGILPWLGVILSYIFTGFWVLPIFWISKPINSIWFQVSFNLGGKVGDYILQWSSPLDVTKGDIHISLLGITFCHWLYIGYCLIGV